MDWIRYPAYCAKLRDAEFQWKKNAPNVCAYSENLKSV